MLHRCEFNESRNSIWLSYENLPSAYTTISSGKEESLELVEIWGSKVEMLGLVEILQEKYGPPKKTNNFVENGMSTKFDQEVSVWVDGQGNRITVESIYLKIDEGRVLIESAARVSEREILDQKAEEVRKSNL